MNGKGSSPRQDPNGNAKRNFGEGWDRIWKGRRDGMTKHKLTNSNSGMYVVGIAETEVEVGKSFIIEYEDFKVFVTDKIKHVVGGYPSGLQFKTHSNQWYELQLTNDEPGIYFPEERGQDAEE